MSADFDISGRAFPAFEMSSLFIGAKDDDINHLLPVCLASGDGTTMTFSTSKDALAVDKVLRAICITMGYTHPRFPSHIGSKSTLIIS